VSLASRIIDAMVDDFELAELPRHNTTRYKVPAAILPEDCPLLVVRLISKASGPMTVKERMGQITVEVSWHEEAVERAETLMDDPDAARSQLDAIEVLEQRVWLMERATQETQFDVPEANRVMTAAVNYQRGQPVETGLVEGYAMTVQIDVTED
jgi:hypothetical protein